MNHITMVPKKIKCVTHAGDWMLHIDTTGIRVIPELFSQGNLHFEAIAQGSRNSRVNLHSAISSATNSL